LVVSKPLFYLLSLVAIFTAGAGLQSGAVREEETGSLHAEIRADVRSLKADSQDFARRVEFLPLSLHFLWADFRAEWTGISADATSGTRVFTRQVKGVLKHEPAS
jgi:hypothetical protein